jgi:hypothetical protein
MMDFDYIEKNTGFWFEENLDYVYDDKWQINTHNPSIYPAFKWMEIHNLRTPLFYFSIHLREHTNATMLRSLILDSDRASAKLYGVNILAAYSEVPLSISEWEYDGKSPWQGSNMHANLFYMGEKYLDYFKVTYGFEKSVGTPSSLSMGFEIIEDARLFIEEWKDKLLFDHKEELEKDSILYRKIHTMKIREA